MQNIEIAPIKKNFDFVDTIRCISMIGIVFEHCSVFWGTNYNKISDKLIQMSGLQFFKFVSIAFFIIGGFLINHKFTENTPLQYLKNRFNNTIGPWAFWIAILIILDGGYNVLMYYKTHGDRSLPDFWEFLGTEIYHTVFFTSFWFVLNFLICITVLLIFKRYLYSVWFGIFWGIVSLLYSLNLYHGWIATEHTLALFGFVVYLWMGVYMNKHYDKVLVFLKGISYTKLIILNVVLFMLAIAEVYYRADHGYEDWYNTLRVTNILYSLGMFLLLLKIGKIGWLNKALQPRQTTFGVYLLHTIVLSHIIPEILRHLHVVEQKLNVVDGIGFSIFKFILAYGISFLIVKVIMHTKLKWSIGIRS
jgi:hypothetical protein